MGQEPPEAKPDKAVGTSKQVMFDTRFEGGNSHLQFLPA
jgi:hypothetical protein